MKFQEKALALTPVQKKISQGDGNIEKNAYLCVHLDYLISGNVGLDLPRITAEAASKTPKHTVLFADPQKASAFIQHPLCEKKWACIQIVDLSSAAVTINADGIKNITEAALKTLSERSITGAWCVASLSGNILQTGNMPTITAIPSSQNTATNNIKPDAALIPAIRNFFSVLSS